MRILAIICEELGVFGVIVMMTLFGYLLYRIYKIAQNAWDIEGKVLAIGVFTQIALQLLINVMVVTSVIPTTGVTLPFFSAGGTSVVFLLAELGMVLNVDKYAKERRFFEEAERHVAQMEQRGGIGADLLSADLEVLCAEAGGGVDAAGAGVQGDMLAVEDDALPVEEGVLGAHQLELAALEGGQHGAGGVVNARGLAHALGQILSQHVHIAARHLEEHVVELRVEADGVVAGDRPGGGRPDYEVGAGQVGILAQLALVVGHGELDEDGGAGVVGVLNLGLGQGGLVKGAPVHRLHALVDEALVVEGDEHMAHRVGQALVHGEPGAAPVTGGAQLLLLLHDAVAELDKTKRT